VGLIKQILVPSDFSETSERALEFAMKLAHDTDATLHLLNVDDDPVLNSPTTSEQFRDKYEDKLATILASLLDDDSRQELTPTYSIRRGDAAVEIVNYANENGIDLIVMGGKGRSAIADILLGSVASKVLHSATCPVVHIPFPKS
jgi:nucleotide-binding universal stress UspA family protein